MKTIIGWILSIWGGIFCLGGMIGMFGVLLDHDGLMVVRVCCFITLATLTAGSGLLMRKGNAMRRKQQEPSTAPATKASQAKKDIEPVIEPEGEKDKPETTPTFPEIDESLMTSQFPAMFEDTKDLYYHSVYLQKLGALGISEEDARKLFAFELDVIRRHEKAFLLDPEFTINWFWFFDRTHPYFRSYPVEQEDILKEKYLTISELCKLIDEAEWHYWNVHEMAFPDEVWAEICQWRLNGGGADFAIRYFEMISAETGVSMDTLAPLSSAQGGHLNRYKWSAGS